MSQAQQKMLSQYKSWLISGAISVAIVLWLISGQFDGGTKSFGPEPASHTASVPRPSVRIREQVAELVTRNVVVNGRTAPARVVELNAETEGRVTFIGVARGDRFDAGDIIVRLDERDRQARLAQAEATVRQREVEFDARAKLKGASYVSEAQLQEAQAQLEGARAELARARLDIEYTEIRAPFDGALQARNVEIGDFVKVGDPVATVVDERTLIVSAGISEFDARYVRKGDKGSAKLATGEWLTGTIRYVAPVADEATRTFLVELAVDNSEGKLRGGVTAELSIPAESVLAHKISPSLLTLDADGNLGVKTVNEDGKVEFYLADVAQSSSDGVWIAGLPEKTSIITVGQGFVNEGSLVDAIPDADIKSAVAIKSSQREN